MLQDPEAREGGSKVSPNRTFQRILFSVLACVGLAAQMFFFANVVQCRRSNGQAILTVEDSTAEQLQDEAEKLNCRVEVQALPLEDIYRIIVS